MLRSAALSMTGSASAESARSGFPAPMSALADRRRRGMLRALSRTAEQEATTQWKCVDTRFALTDRDSTNCLADRRRSREAVILPSYYPCWQVDAAGQAWGRVR